VNEDPKDLAIDLSEVALDSLSENELVKDIPVIGTFVRLARVTRSIPDLIFAKKVERFISASEPIARDKRTRFHARLEAEPELRRKAGECIVLTLDRVDDLKKAAIIGKLFSHFVAGEITFEILRRMLAAVDRAFIDDLLNFPQWALQQRFADGFDPRSLDGTGLVEPAYARLGGIRSDASAAPQFGYSQLGGVYARLFLGYEPQA
jgi:integrase